MAGKREKVIEPEYRYRAHGLSWPHERALKHMDEPAFTADRSRVRETPKCTKGEVWDCGTNDAG